MSKNDFLNAINLLQIKQGDTLSLHTSVLNLGFPVVQTQIYLQTLCEILFEAVGEEGTIAMPTFTYSFCKGEIYDPQKSFSKMGSLNEFFRKNYAKRTLDPNFSYAIWGKKSDYLLNADTKESFGDDGIFARLRNINAKLLDIGNTYDLTFWHYIEKIAKVSYRFDKKFNGQICDNGKIYDTYNIYFVRDLNRPSICDFRRIYEYLKQNLHSYKQANIAQTKIICFDLNETFEISTKKLKIDEKYFLKKETK
nr:AAC(3) family N-acetyltransferase [Campylobacter sp.]